MLEKLSEIILKFFNYIGLDNELEAFIIGIFVIFIFEKCKKNIELSSGELLFMKKKNAVFRDTISGVVLLIAISIANYVFIKEDNLCLTLIVCVGLIIYSFILYRKKKGINAFYFIITAVGIIISFLFYSLKSDDSQIGATDIAIAFAIMETVFILFIYANLINGGGHKAKYYIKEDDKPWYIYRIMDEKTMLCGDDIDSWNNTLIKLFKYDSNTLFYKVNSSNKKEEPKEKQEEI